MADKAQTVEANAADPADTPTAAAPAAGTPAPRRSPGHRGADMRDTMAELAARAQEISQDAGSKIAGAMNAPKAREKWRRCRVGATMAPRERAHEPPCVAPTKSYTYRRTSRGDTAPRPNL